MRTWFFAAVCLAVVSAGLVYFSASPIGFTPVNVDVSPETITNPLYFPRAVGVLLFLSVCSFFLTRPSSTKHYSPTESGALGIFGALGWFSGAMMLGFAGLFLANDVLGGYFHTILLSSAVSQVVFVGAGATFLFTQHKYDQLRAFRELNSWRSALVRGTVGYLRLFPLLLVASMVNVYLFRWLEVELTVPQSIQFFGSASSPRRMALLFLLLVVVAPICEEYFFRGVIYNVCREWATPGVAALGSSFIFSGVHREPMWFLPVLILGFYLAREYERTDGLKVPIVVHGIQNGLSFAMLYFALG